MRTGPRSSIGDTPHSYCRDMTEALEADPPVITWEKRNGVMVAVSVEDPHTETTAAERLEQARLRLRRHQQEADEVAERFRKHHAENIPLLTSARRPI